MIFIFDSNLDPYFNLAAEEYLLKNFTEPVFRLWRNSACVVIGKYQNAYSEINVEYVRENGIKVVRRLTGGGAVFHDPGNINFTFIDARREDEDTSEMFRRFTSPIVEALKAKGIDARLSGRNDLLIGERKFSGNALCVDRNRVLQHGTLLFNSSMAKLGAALKNRSIKYSDKAVKSNVSRVTNISEHLEEPLTAEEFMKYLGDFVAAGCQPYEYTSQDLAAIEKLRDEKYSQQSWNFGSSPKYTFSNAAKLSCGVVEISFSVEKGIISQLHISGDYFFIRPTEEFCSLLAGCPHTKTAIAERISKIALGDYFGQASPEELAALFF